MNLIFLDSETTGLKDSRLIELGYQLHGATVPTVIRCKPPIPIELGAMAVHHITPKMLKGEEVFVDRADYKDIKELFEHSDTVAIAHHAMFDIGVLEREGIRIHSYIDTKEVAKELYPKAECHQLQYLRYMLGCEVTGDAHSAGGDVAVLKAVWEALIAFDGEDAIVERFRRNVQM